MTVAVLDPFNASDVFHVLNVLDRRPDDWAVSDGMLWVADRGRWACAQDVARELVAKRWLDEGTLLPTVAGLQWLGGAR